MWLAGALSASGIPFMSQKTMKFRRPDAYVACVSTSQARAMTASMRSRSSSVYCEVRWARGTRGRHRHNLWLAG